MKAKRIAAALSIGLSLLLCVAIGTAIYQSTARATMPAAPAVLGSESLGNLAAGRPVLGNSSAVLQVTGSGAVAGNATFLMGSGSVSAAAFATGATLTLSGGTGNVACTGPCLVLSTTSGSVFIGSGSGSCTCPVTATGQNTTLVVTSGTGTATITPGQGQFLALPQLTNIDQLYIKLVGSSSATATADVELIYQQ